MLELTVPWEEHIEEANKRKHAKYLELLEKCKDRGWKTYYKPIEVGCKGFIGVSKKRAIRSASKVTEKATRWLWIKRADPWTVAAGTQVGTRLGSQLGVPIINSRFNQISSYLKVNQVTLI
ncbi:hypothetical protein SRHO_G00268120 [Serrasalmus rhombeus]